MDPSFDVLEPSIYLVLFFLCVCVLFFFFFAALFQLQGCSRNALPGGASVTVGAQRKLTLKLNPHPNRHSLGAKQLFAAYRGYEHDEPSMKEAATTSDNPFCSVLTVTPDLQKA